MAKQEDKKKPSIEESSLQELKEALENAKRDHKRCYEVKCENCASDRHCFSGRLAETNCGTTRGLLEVVVDREERKLAKAEEVKEKKSFHCSDCKWLNREFYEKYGYCFCLHWHNFSELSGFCHAFEAVESHP